MSIAARFVALPNPFMSSCGGGESRPAWVKEDRTATITHSLSKQQAKKGEEVRVAPGPHGINVHDLVASWDFDIPDWRNEPLERPEDEELRQKFLAAIDMPPLFLESPPRFAWEDIEELLEIAAT